MGIAFIFLGVADVSSNLTISFTTWTHFSEALCYLSFLAFPIHWLTVLGIHMRLLPLTPFFELYCRSREVGDHFACSCIGQSMLWHTVRIEHVRIDCLNATLPKFHPCPKELASFSPSLPDGHWKLGLCLTLRKDQWIIWRRQKPKDSSPTHPLSSVSFCLPLSPSSKLEFLHQRLI